MAMLDLQIEVEELPLEFNFPLHLADQFSVTKKIVPDVLHYHWLHDGVERLQLTGHPILDEAVIRINKRLCLARMEARIRGRL